MKVLNCTTNALSKRKLFFLIIIMYLQRNNSEQLFLEAKME